MTETLYEIVTSVHAVDLEESGNKEEEKKAKQFLFKLLLDLVRCGSQIQVDVRAFLSASFHFSLEQRKMFLCVSACDL